MTAINNNTSSISSINTTISTLAPISGLSSIYATSVQALLNVKCNSIQTDANAAVLGDVLYGLGQTSLSTLTTVVNGKAPLASPSFTGALTTAGDIKFNGTSSLSTLITSNLAPKTSGSIASTTTFQTLYSSVNQRGFIYVAAGAPCYSTAMAFFEAYTGYSYGSLTLMAQSGNASSAAINTSNATTGGVVKVSLQMSSGAIQVKTTASTTVQWFVINF